LARAGSKYSATRPKPVCTKASPQYNIFAIGKTESS
jgi:hypothetical protein